MESRQPAKSQTISRPISVVLYEPEGPARTRLLNLLRPSGFHVHGVHDADTLFRWLNRHPAQLVVLGAGTPQGLLTDTLLPRLEAEHAAGVVVQRPGAQADLCMRVLGAGAHLCLDREYEGPEFAAVLRAQARRAGLSAAGRGTMARASAVPPPRRAVRYPGILPPLRVANPASHEASSNPSMPSPGSPAAPWSLMYQGWVLMAPDGTRIPLTGLERSCFTCMLESPQRELSRKDLSRFMSEANLRSMNVVISRLRKKVLQAGQRLPLHTVHRLGYVFAGTLVANEEG
ncbi:winged helix-turn-helix domain-containing protein [Bordetella sp. LUAb4]|uniref:winged helix-turn-helix domain-containing protein n=1 Tax=Bordetella sp. LUAb4 TaxID=2843195 RepID=UPI001E5993ED|nr:winged helix-turn-helix domain-containing protein [Bordetella sp. LUAb4]